MSDLFARVEAQCGLSHINMTEMCKLAGVSRSAMTDLKSGRKTGLSAATLEKLSRFFGVSVDYLLTGVPPVGQNAAGSRQCLALYFEERLGRPPAGEEIRRMEEYLDIFLKSLGK